MLVISDTSPIIALYQLNLIDLMFRLHPNIVIPPEVATELQRGCLLGRSWPNEQVIERFTIRSPLDATRLQTVGYHLDPGETAAIALALETPDQSLLLMDERAGRKRARQLNLTITGTIGMLIIFKRNGWINAVRPLLVRLKVELQFHLSESDLTRFSRMAGE